MTTAKLFFFFFFLVGWGLKKNQGGCGLVGGGGGGAEGDATERESEGKRARERVRGRTRVVKVSAALLALSIDRGRKTFRGLCSPPAPLPLPASPKSPTTKTNGPSRDLVEHVVAEGQARVRLECRQGFRPASGQGHFDDREEFRRVRYELRELGGGAHFYVAGLREISAMFTGRRVCRQGAGASERDGGEQEEEEEEEEKKSLNRRRQDDRSRKKKVDFGLEAVALQQQCVDCDGR